MHDIEAARLDCFFFSTPDGIQSRPHINAVSSATQPDYETIDASVLMSSDYLPPLVSTDLGSLIESTLSVEGSTWLRHSAACKAVKWLRKRRHQGWVPNSALSCGQISLGSSLAQYPPTKRSLDRQYWGRIEMSSWAEGLRQSLSAERLDLSRQQSVQNISVTPRRLAMMTLCQLQSTSRRPGTPLMTINHQDPLGLLQLVSKLQTGGRMTLELLSSFGIIGCVITWVIRPELLQQWDVKLPPCLYLV
jgi:hypothetical protein